MSKEDKSGRGVVRLTSLKRRTMSRGLSAACCLAVVGLCVSGCPMPGPALPGVSEFTGLIPEDEDHDGIPWWQDNCPHFFNPGQGDSDGDDIGDFCDPRDDRDTDDDTTDGLEPSDGDGDGVGDPADNCRYDRNPDQADTDGDGIGNACDDAGDRFVDRASWYDSGDSRYAPDEATNEGNVRGPPDDAAAYIGYPPNGSHYGVSVLTCYFDNAISNGSGADLRIHGLNAWDCRGGGCSGALVEIDLVIDNLTMSIGDYRSLQLWVEQESSILDIDLSDWVPEITSGLHQLTVTLSITIQTERCGESWTGFYCGPGASLDAMEVLHGDGQ